MKRTIKLFPLFLMAASLCSGSAGTTRAASSSPDAQPLEVTTAVIPGLLVNHTYALHLTAKGGSPPYTWNLVEGTLPPGLHLNRNGWLTGTPKEVRSDQFTIRVTDSATNSAEVGLEFTPENTTVDDLNEQRPEASTISSKSLSAAIPLLSSIRCVTPRNRNHDSCLLLFHDLAILGE